MKRNYMKKQLLLLLMTLSLIKAFAQGFMVIDDPHIKAQQDRMVLTSWGNFLPKPRYFLGVQTSIHFMRTWGWLAPPQNGAYRKGKDIRPLGPTGEQTQRMLLNAALLETSEVYREYTDSIRQTAIKEMTYYSGSLSESDPLWRLYYKSELKDVRNFNPESMENALSEEEIAYLSQTGILNWFSEQMGILQQRLEAAFTTDMDRGSRILTYHRILLEYRQLRSRWDHHLIWANRMLAFRKSADRSLVPTSDVEYSWKASNDADRMSEIIRRAKTTY